MFTSETVYIVACIVIRIGIALSVAVISGAVIEIDTEHVFYPERASERKGGGLR